MLRGNESEQYQYYIDHFLKDKQYLNDLFSLYPVLERRINEIIQNAIDIYKEVIERIEKDADVLMKKFNITEKGFVVTIFRQIFLIRIKKGEEYFVWNLYREIKFYINHEVCKMRLSYKRLQIISIEYVIWEVMSILYLIKKCMVGAKL